MPLLSSAFSSLARMPQGNRISWMLSDSYKTLLLRVVAYNLLFEIAAEYQRSVVLPLGGIQTYVLR